jgi:hypothetical protein
VQVIHGNRLFIARQVGQLVVEGNVNDCQSAPVADPGMERLLTEAELFEHNTTSSTAFNQQSRVILYVLAVATVGWSVLIVGAVWYALRWLT